jgi:hypothetical protein
LKTIDYDNPWIYKDEPFTSEDIGDYIGFVYLLTDPDGKKYIGKKLFVSRRKLPPLKGKTRKRTVIKESDWKTYMDLVKRCKTLLSLISHSKEKFCIFVKQEAHFLILKQKNNLIEMFC